MIKQSITSMVSSYTGAGKSHAAQVLVRSDMDFYKHSFTWDLSRIGDMFLGFDCGKYDVHPYLGVCKKDIINAVTKTLEDMHPELPVMRTKQAILQFIDDGHSVVIDDVRRYRDFKWLDMVAHDHGIKHHIIEILPVGDLQHLAQLDMWTNNIEKCGSDVWRGGYHTRISNDGSEGFQDELLKVVSNL